MSVNQNDADYNPNDDPKVKPSTNEPRQNPSTTTKGRVAWAIIFASLAALFGGWGSFLVNIDHKLAQTSLFLFWIGTVFSAFFLRLLLRNLNRTKRIYNGWCYGSLGISTFICFIAFLWLRTMQYPLPPSTVSLVLSSVESEAYNLRLTNEFLLHKLPVTGGFVYDISDIKGCLIIPVDSGKLNCKLQFAVENNSDMTINDLRILAVIPADVNIFAESTESVVPQVIPPINRMLPNLSLPTNSTILEDRAFAIERLSPLWPERHSEFAMEFLNIEYRDTRWPILVRFDVMPDALKSKDFLFSIAFCDKNGEIYKYLSKQYKVSDSSPFVVNIGDLKDVNLPLSLSDALFNPTTPADTREKAREEVIKQIRQARVKPNSPSK